MFIHILKLVNRRKKNMGTNPIRKENVITILPEEFVDSLELQKRIRRISGPDKQLLTADDIKHIVLSKREAVKRITDELSTKFPEIDRAKIEEAVKGAFEKGKIGLVREIISQQLEIEELRKK